MWGFTHGAHPFSRDILPSKSLTERRRPESCAPAWSGRRLEAEGSAWDLRAADGDDAPTYADQLTPKGLDRLAGEVDGISLDKRIVLEHPSVVADAHRRGLDVYVWTCRPENAFLDPLFRGPGDDAAFGDWEGEWRRIAETGVDGVFVDHPDLGVAFFAHPGRSGDAR